ncbi:MAG: hypothetical protein EOO60_03220 [Hymenobacter sp.]|nr:MAG: hypothetical protein EOO60_03220 [Hymenobacter sp.]
MTEYHVRLLEYQQLVNRAAGSGLLTRHRMGVEEAREKYTNEPFRRGPDKKRVAWAKQYFPELTHLLQQY